MKPYLGAFAMAAPLLVAVVGAPALAQKSGGILKIYSPDSPTSMSIHEEATFVAEGPLLSLRGRNGRDCCTLCLGGLVT